MGKQLLWGYRCYRCKHEWLARSEDAPKVCPNCKNPYWDTPKLRFVGKVGKFDSEEIYFPKENKIFGTIQTLKTDIFLCVFSFNAAPDSNLTDFVDFAYQEMFKKAKENKCKYFIVEWVEDRDPEMKLIKKEGFRLMKPEDYPKVGIIRNHPSWNYYMKEISELTKPVKKI